MGYKEIDKSPFFVSILQKMRLHHSLCQSPHDFHLVFFPGKRVRLSIRFLQSAVLHKEAQPDHMDNHRT